MITTKNINSFVWLTGILWIVFLFVAGIKVPDKFLQPVSLIIGFWTIFLGAYEKWIWRWDCIGLLFEPQPDLNGTWQGRLISSFVDPQTKQRVPEIEVYFSVTQTYSTINYKMFTKDMASELISGRLIKDENGQFSIYGIYRSIPNILLREKSPIHFGAVNFAYSQNKIEGSYWTDRDTKGTITFSKKINSIIFDFENAKNAFPE